jgi:hypothetical protein
MAATMMAGGAFAAYSVRSATRPQAPNCPSATGKSTDWAPDDLDGCWERRGDQSFFRTTSGGHYYYHWEPPPTSRYYGEGSVGG